MAWLRLIRWKNLLIILFTQFLAWSCVILPEHPKVLNPLNFLLLTVSTMLIAAAGYIINDYFDIKIDTINHPEKVILEKIIPRKQAIIAHTVLNLIALALAGIVAIEAHHLEWLSLQLACTLLLWFYSTHFKRQYITGNIVVALLTAFTVIALILYEPVMQHDLRLPPFNGASPNHLWANPVYTLLIYAFFAFALTWIREIVKDMEDLAGDALDGCVTMPVKWGALRTIKFTRLLGVFTACLLAYSSACLLLTGNLFLGAYVVLLVIVPLITLMVYLGKKTTPAHFHKASSSLKMIMVSGAASLIIYHSIIWARSF